MQAATWHSCLADDRTATAGAGVRDHHPTRINPPVIPVDRDERCATTRTEHRPPSRCEHPFEWAARCSQPTRPRERDLDTGCTVAPSLEGPGKCMENVPTGLPRRIALRPLPTTWAHFPCTSRSLGISCGQVSRMRPRRYRFSLLATRDRALRRDDGATLSDRLRFVMTEDPSVWTKRHF